MLEKIGHVKNPLTVISIFAGIAEISGTAVLPFISAAHQGTYIWFLMLFPIFLVTSFFLTLNFNHRVLYAPSDYKDEKDFHAKTSVEERRGKAEQEAQFELTKESMVYEVESIDGNEEIPNDSEKSEEVKLISKEILVKNSLMLESSVLTSLRKGGVPFPHSDYKEEFSISIAGRKYLIDAVIETEKVHYLIEIKNILRPSSLVNAVHQIRKYKVAYESYLHDRNINVFVQPIIVVPSSINISSVFRGIPIAKFDTATDTIINLKPSYPDYEFTAQLESSETLAPLLIKFLKEYSRWGFSPLRIQKWGAKQSGFDNLELYSDEEIKLTLESLLQKRILTELLSKKGNRLYKINSNQHLD